MKCPACGWDEVHPTTNTNGERLSGTPLIGSAGGSLDESPAPPAPAITEGERDARSGMVAVGSNPSGVLRNVENTVAPLPEPIAAGGGEVKGVLGDCICEQNAEDYMRPCPVHAPSESERELAKECLAWCSGVYLNTHDPAEILAKAAAVIDRQVSRQDAYRSVLHQVYDEATYRLKPSWEKVGQWTFAVLRGTKDA
jgi:hypothetical protein